MDSPPTLDASQEEWFNWRMKFVHVDDINGSCIKCRLPLSENRPVECMVKKED
jgi:hypothetical protein